MRKTADDGCGTGYIIYNTCMMMSFWFPGYVKLFYSPISFFKTWNQLDSHLYSSDCGEQLGLHLFSVGLKQLLSTQQGLKTQTNDKW